MKHSLALIIALSLNALSPSLFARTVMFKTDFGPAEFKAGPLDESGPWKTNGGYPFEVKEDGTAGKKVVQILESSTEAAGPGSRAWLKTADFTGGNKIAVELDLRTSPSGGAGYQANVHVGNLDGAPKPVAAGEAAVVSIRAYGSVVVYDGKTEKRVANVKGDEWVHLRIEADADSKTYSVSINGEPAATGLAFRDPSVDWIRSVGFTHYSGAEIKNPSSMAVSEIEISGF